MLCGTVGPMNEHRLLIPGNPSNWRTREHVPEGRMLLLGRALILGKELSSEDAEFAGTMMELTDRLAANDIRPWGDMGEGLF